ncbi:hypothetical protein QYE76_008521 [Lolium multiflorum]|uniref:Uncharacterized protein n=1 Tax=Lolium multiflorum TaxID=4521 RepID=A0AAD8TTF2_LOLMU|nr:hypothetical protein QYE76_008521 [Lolium multiflorum]
MEPPPPLLALGSYLVGPDQNATYIGQLFGLGDNYRLLQPAGFIVPPGSLSVFLFLSIVLFTSLNVRLLVPLASRLTRRPQGLTSLQRVGTGLVFAIVAMAVAALVEKMRRDASSNGDAISAFWLVPQQFFLVGAGEAFVPTPAAGAARAARVVYELGGPASAAVRREEAACGGRGRGTA